MRQKVIINILQIVNSSLWKESSNDHDNEGPKLTVIGKTLLDGNDSYIEQIFDESKGVLGLYDLIHLRYYVSAYGDLNLFQVRRALIDRARPEPLTTEQLNQYLNDYRLIMREFTQHVYGLIVQRYIKTKVNFIEQIYALDIDVLSGSYAAYFRSHYDHAEIEKVALTEHSSIIGFITYQLTANQIESGVPLGIYDPDGDNDSGKIREQVLDYLFDVCFNPKLSISNARYFIDYLLCHYDFSHSVRGIKYRPNIDGFIKLLSKDRLGKYWGENSADVKAHLRTLSGQKVYTPNYIAEYDERIDELFAVLDKSFPPLPRIR